MVIHDDCCIFVGFFLGLKQNCFSTLLKPQPHCVTNHFWLSYSNLRKLCFEIFLIALKGNRRLNQWYPVGISMKRMWFFVFSVKDIFVAHSS